MTMKWNEWLVCKVVASALWIIQGMLSNFHAPTLLFKGENLSKETYGTKQNVEDCEIGILKCISYLYSAYLKKWFEAYQMDISSKLFPDEYYYKKSWFSFVSLFFRLHLTSKTCQDSVFMCSRNSINPIFMNIIFC